MFELDQRLMSDTAVGANSSLCRILLMNDSRYPWLILVPRIASVSEVFELTAEQQQQLWQETSDVGRLLKNEFQADKMNIATLGNVVKQLHMHVVVRMQEDASWPAPVWGNGVAQPYTADALTQMCLRLRSVLAPMDLLDAEVDL